MISTSSIPSRSQKIVIRKIKDEYLLIPLTSDIADMDSLYRLNETGVFIWDAIDGRRSIRDITLMMAEEFDVEPDEAEKDILSFIAGVQEFLEFS
jgi:hypothetical protein